MEFFYDLYNDENFVIYLFITIAVLTFIFLILVLSGRNKDKNKKKVEDQKVSEIANNSTVGVTPTVVEEPKVLDNSIPVVNESTVLNIPTPAVEAPVSEPIVDNNVAVEESTVTINPVPAIEPTIFEQKPVIDNAEIILPTPTTITEDLPIEQAKTENSPVVADSITLTPITSEPIIMSETPVPVLNPIEIKPIEDSISLNPGTNIPNNGLEIPEVKEEISLEVPVEIEPIIKTEPLEETPTSIEKEQSIVEDDLPKLKEEKENPLDISETYRIK